MQRKDLKIAKRFEQILIRKAVGRDRAGLLAMMLDLWPHERKLLEGKSVTQLKHTVNKGRVGEIFVAEANGKSKGFIAVGQRAWCDGAETAPLAFVEGWYVAAGRRRQGLGRALMKAAEQWARKEGFKELGSDTWLHNHGSIRAHQSLGFKVTEKLVYFSKRVGVKRS